MTRPSQQMEPRTHNALADRSPWSDNGRRAAIVPGQRFGRLTVSERAGHSERDVLVRCACDCGAVHVVSWTPLRKGEARSCGCLRADAMSLRRLAGISPCPAWLVNGATT
jgi:hypothetical protein